MLHHTADSTAHVTIRLAHPGDERELARLAALDSARAPAAPALVAESDARLLAALPLGPGRPVADPFEPTAELIALLELRAAQLRDGRARRGGLRERLAGLVRTGPAEAQSTY
jgi:hypothetical protein